MASDTKQHDGKVRTEGAPSRAPGASPQPAAGARPRRGEVQTGIADADKKARTGSEQEPVRDTPPGGDWNDVA
jgi:hypothetical protein